jgi:hypothetical protein
MTMPRLLLTLTALMTAIVVAVGCGDSGSSSSSASSLAPAGSIVYGEATLQPEGDQKETIDALVEKFPGQGSAGERIRALMQKAFAESDSGLDYRKDIEPWLGDEAAFFLSRIDAAGDDGDGGLLVATDDEQKALAALDKAIDGKKASYKDTEYFTEDGGAAGVVDGWVVIATVRGFKAAVDVAGDGPSLEDDEDFQKTLDDASGERLGYIYVNTPALLKTLQRSAAGAQLGQFGQLFKEPLLATMNAADSAIRFEATVPKSLAAGFPVVAEGADLAGELPGDSWLAAAQPDLGKVLEQYIDLYGGQVGGRENLEQQFKAMTGLDLQEDVLSWMGTYAVFVRGTSVSDLSGALIVETSDEQKSGRVLDTIARFARQSADPQESVGPLELSGGGEGYTLHTPDVPEPIHLFQQDGKVVLAYGDEAAADAISPSQTLSDTPEFSRAEDALGGDYNVSFYLSMEPILELVESTGAGSSEEYAKIKPYLEPFGAFVGGAQENGDKLRSAFGVTIR